MPPQWPWLQPAAAAAARRATPFVSRRRRSSSSSVPASVCASAPSGHAREQEDEQSMVVVGGGAAGVYASIRAKTLAPHLNVVVIEKGKFLSKGQFKDEFVTAGGVPLSEISLSTMESKKQPNLFFAGEVLNVDGVTGGFNFQNAWTGGYIAGTSIGTLASSSILKEEPACLELQGS